MKEKLFKKGIVKRLFSVVLAVAMVFSLMPINNITVYADLLPTASCTIHPDANHFIFISWNESMQIAEGTTFTTDGGIDNPGESGDKFETTPSSGVSVATWYYYDAGTNKYKLCPGTHGGSTHTHSWSYTFDNNQHWQKCSSCTETQGQENHNWVRSTDGSTTKCETCGAYVTVSAESGVTPKTVKDCVTVTTNLSTTPDFVVMDTSNNPAVNVALTTSAEGNYQAIAQVATGVNPYADFTLTNPQNTAATGDNRPIELLVFGFAAMAAMAAAAFTVDRKRR